MAPAPLSLARSLFGLDERRKNEKTKKHSRSSKEEGVLSGEGGKGGSLDDPPPKRRRSSRCRRQLAEGQKVGLARAAEQGGHARHACGRVRGSVPVGATGRPLQVSFSVEMAAAAALVFLPPRPSPARVSLSCSLSLLSRAASPALPPLRKKPWDARRRAKVAAAAGGARDEREKERDRKVRESGRQGDDGVV